jgi:hypothetical protein
MAAIIVKQIMVNDVVEKTKRTAESKGFFAACLMSFAMVGLKTLTPDNDFLNLLFVVIVPLIIAFVFLKNFMHALTLTWLNEMFFGVGGTWIKFGPIPGRGMLLFVALLIYVIARPNVIGNIIRYKRDSWIVFYGVIFPIILLIYSVIIRGNAFSAAVSDVQRFLIILIFFPLRDLIKRHFCFVLGWLICTTTVLSLLFVILAIAPDDFRLALLERWLYSYSGGDDGSGIARVLSSGRAFFTPLILCWLSVFLGIVYAVDIKIKALKRVASILLLSVASAAFVVNFARGPILAIFILFILLFLVLSGFKREQIIRGVNLIVAVIIILSAGYVVTVKYLPIALTKWDMRGMAFEQAIDTVRIEQTELLLNEWLAEPILGQGVGSPITSGYERDESGLSFEVQYPVILYRTGFVGFCFIMIPFFLIMARTAIRTRKNPGIFNTDEGKLFLALACSIGALLVASWLNPYLASSMTFVFIALYFATESVLPIMPILKR